MDTMCAVVLAAGAGVRLRPLTDRRPKALCPVGDRPLVDLALERVASVVPQGPASVAVNIHHGRAALEAHLGDSVHRSVEEPAVLGTGGALGALRDWIAGRDALVLNADAWCPGPLAGVVGGWDHQRVRVAVAGPEGFGPASPVVASLVPWSVVAQLEPVPSGLYERCWAPAAAAGRLDVVHHDGPFLDCGTPARYLAANLAAAGGASVVGHGATVLGRLTRSVVWPGATVAAGEHLVDAVRADHRCTVLVR